MTSVPHFVYVARPVAKVRLRGLFDRGPLRRAIEQPAVLREHGWTMETQEEARIVKGEHLEIQLGDWKTIQLYEDGMLLAKVRADAEFLAWGSRTGDGFEKRPRLNPLALAEFTYSFVDVFGNILAHVEPAPETCVLQVNIQHAFREGGPLYLNPFGLETTAHTFDTVRYSAPEDSAQISVELSGQSIRESAAVAAYKLFESIYLWFGVPTEKIPYVTGAGTTKSIDVALIRRGGKA